MFEYRYIKEASSKEKLVSQAREESVDADSESWVADESDGEKREDGVEDVAQKATEEATEKKPPAKIALILKFTSGQAEKDRNDFLSAIPEELKLKTSDGQEHLFRVSPYLLADGENDYHKNLVKIELPSNNTKEIRARLKKFLESHSPESFYKSPWEKGLKKIKHAQKFILQLKNDLFEHWNNIKNHPTLINAKNFVQESFVYKLLARKLVDFFAWFNETPLGKKVQAKLAVLNEKKEEALAIYREKRDHFLEKYAHYKSRFDEKAAIAKKWLDYTASHMKKYFAQLIQEPHKWGKRFIQVPSRYPSVLSILSAGAFIGLFYGVKVVGFSLLAGTTVFAATHLRNYLYQQRKEVLVARALDSEIPEVENDGQVSSALEQNLTFMQGKAAGKTWSLWFKDCADKKLFTSSSWLDYGAGMHSSTEETVQSQKKKNSL